VIGAIYDDGVCAGDVYAVFDDGGCNQNVIFVVNEVEHHSLHILFVHLPVAHGETRVRHKALHERRNRLDRLHAIVNEEDLAAARKLEVDCRLDHTLRKLHHLRLNREPIARRRFDERHVAHAAERHVERTWNRRRGKRQHVDFFLRCLSRSLWATPKRCSSSTTTSPRSLNDTSLERMRCVPMITSTSPASIRFTTSFCSFEDRKRDSNSTFTGNGAKRLRNVS